MPARDTFPAGVRVRRDVEGGGERKKEERGRVGGEERIRECV